MNVVLTRINEGLRTAGYILPESALLKFIFSEWKVGGEFISIFKGSSETPKSQKVPV